jgi:hypothetical protein|tara:strand:- start:485 stop:1537 length:1053 start_codon:yes stop_codon:yes gene_type:complete
MKIAIIGGGIFGVTIATNLAKNHSIDLYEQQNDILQSASGINQYRVHRGYHYPRSSDTAIAVSNIEPLFKKEYHDSIIQDVDHYYCIAKEHSLTNSQQFQNFCSNHNLEFTQSNLDLLNSESIQLCVKVKEDLFDPSKLKAICLNKLKSANVNLLLNTKANDDIFSNYDFVIICTYANINSILSKYPLKQINYQFEICEKPVVQLPSSFKKKSIVIMDGPFMCVDPFGNSGNFVLGNVVHAIHHTNVGKFPVIPKEFEPLLNNKIVPNPSITNFNNFISSAEKFIPSIRNAKHLGSMFTIRAVPPNVDKTDERPTLIRKIDSNIISVFSGKIPTCIQTSNEIEKMISNFN